MNKKNFLYFFTVLIFTNFAFNEPALEKLIKNTIEQCDKNINIGIKIYSLHDNKSIIDINSERAFLPASTQKLLTLAASLYYLGPYYRFETSFFTDDFKKNGHIKNLYIKGSGDPSLQDGDLIQIARELHQMGITEILGNILVDDSAFDNMLWAKGTMWDDRDRGFAAPVSGLNLNYNRLLIKASPSFLEGEKAFITKFPYSNYIKTHNNTKTSNNINSIKFELNKKDKDNIEGLSFEDNIIFSNNLSLKSSPKYFLFAIKDPAIWVGNFIKEELERFNIKVKGKVQKQITPQTAKLLTKHVSRSLTEALIDFTKISNDMANDSLIKAIAFNAQIKPSALSEGLKLVKKFLSEQVGLNTSDMFISDGSGLSRYNLISPHQLVEILKYAKQKFLMGPEFMAALPIGGEDGTLGNRFQNGLKGKIRAKTGFMTGVLSLAGELEDLKGRRYLLSIMINNFVGETQKYKTLIEDILEIVYFHK